jgi:hypothetical protein
VIRGVVRVLYLSLPCSLARGFQVSINPLGVTPMSIAASRSDRCIVNLDMRSHDERMIDSYISRKRAMIQRRNEICEITLEFVHPGNLGVLPPDPDIILWKAKYIGLIDRKELSRATHPDSVFL